MSLLTGLEAYWRLNETSGTTAADATGNGHTATWHGTLGSQWGGGFANLNGLDNYLDFPSISGIGNAFSIATEVNVHGAPSGNQYVIQMGDDDRNEIVILSSHVTVLTDPNNYIMNSAYTVSQDTWFHIIMTFDGTLLTLYINGLQDSQHATIAIAEGATSYIGQYALNSPHNFFNGKMRKKGIWSRALSPAEASQLNNGGSVLDYPFTTTSLISGLSFPNTNFREQVKIIGY